jgi:hypothetical protein
MLIVVKNVNKILKKFKIILFGNKKFNNKISF